MLLHPTMSAPLPWNEPLRRIRTTQLIVFCFCDAIGYLPPRSANFASQKLMQCETLGELNEPCPLFTGATRSHTLFDCCVN